MLNQSSQVLLGIGSRVGNEEVVALAEYSLGWFHTVSGAYAEAARWLTASLARRTRMGVRSVQVQSQIHLGIAEYRGSGSVETLAAIQAEEVDRAYPLMVPILKLARIEAGLDAVEQVGAIMERLWSQARHIEFLEWVPLAIKVDSLGLRQEIRKRALSAIQKAADLDDAQLRREFLGFARVKSALVAMGS
jgi:hypothetical protein